jgi:quercetin dioxygenase-like cupin family protein
METAGLALSAREIIPPLTIQRGPADLPFVNTMPGVESQLVHVNLETGLWVTRVHLSPGYRSARHRHHGEVFAFTISGRWRYLEQEEVCDAGSYLYEPAGAIHTQHVLEDNPAPADIWFAVMGRNDDLDDAGNVIRTYGAPEVLARYVEACQRQGYGVPPVVGA